MSETGCISHEVRSFHPREPWWSEYFAKLPATDKHNGAGVATRAGKAGGKARVCCKKCLEHGYGVDAPEMLGQDLLASTKSMWLQRRAQSCVVHLRDCRWQPYAVRERARMEQQCHNTKRRARRQKHCSGTCPPAFLYEESQQIPTCPSYPNYVGQFTGPVNWLGDAILMPSQGSGMLADGIPTTFQNLVPPESTNFQLFNQAWPSSCGVVCQLASQWGLSMGYGGAFPTVHQTAAMRDTEIQSSPSWNDAVLNDYGVRSATSTSGYSSPQSVLLAHTYGSHTPANVQYNSDADGGQGYRNVMHPQDYDLSFNLDAV